MANLFDADGAASPARAAAPAEDPRSAVDSVTAVAFPASPRVPKALMALPSIKYQRQSLPLTQARISRQISTLVERTALSLRTIPGLPIFLASQRGCAKRFFTVPSVRPCRRHSATSASMCWPLHPCARRLRLRKERARRQAESRTKPVGLRRYDSARRSGPLRPSRNPEAAAVRPANIPDKSVTEVLTLELRLRRALRRAGRSACGGFATRTRGAMASSATHAGYADWGVEYLVRRLRLRCGCA